MELGWWVHMSMYYLKYAELKIKRIYVIIYKLKENSTRMCVGVQGGVT
jgi:hypothetical protein